MNRFLLFFSFVFCRQIALSQSYWHAREEFGKNSTLQGNVVWRSLTTDNFEINFYKGGEPTARKTAAFAEKELERISDLIGFTPFTQFKIYIFNNAKDLYSNSVGFSDVNDTQNGFTNYDRGTIQMPIIKDEKKYHLILGRYIADLCLFEMLYGNNIRSIFKNAIHLDIEPWFKNGASAFVTRDLTPEEISTIRAIIASGKSKHISRLKGNEAELVGHSIWDYIQKQYGTDAVSNVLNLSRIIRSEVLSISNSLLLPYGQFIKNWENYVKTGQVNQAKDRGFDKVLLPQSAPASIKLRPGEIDTDAYEFDSASLAKFKANYLPEQTTVEKPSEKIAQIKKSQAEPELKALAIKAYENTFLVNASQVELSIDPLRKAGIRSGVVLNDVLENYTIKFESFLTPSWRNSDVAASITYNLGKIDYGLRYDRRTMQYDEITDKNSYIFRPLGYNVAINPNNYPSSFNRRTFNNKFAILLSMPLSRFVRLQMEPNLINTRDLGLGFANLTNPEIRSAFISNKYEVVLDNTQEFFGSLSEGLKAKIRYEHFFDTRLRKSQNFNKLRIDIRKYQPIAGMILATGFAFSKSGGSAPKKVVMGGVENWVNRSIEDLPNKTNAYPELIRDLMFTDFSGPLRGFGAFKVIGDRHMLWNTELRIPLSRFIGISNGSKFIKNFQLVPFSDIGTAWYGSAGPFKRQNSLNTQEINNNGSAFTATVTDFRNPFFYGFGAGARTFIFNHLVSLDYAFSYEDKSKSTPILQLSLNSAF